MSRLDERLENFDRAFEIYKLAVDAFKQDDVLTHMALVQAYEVCFELAWKVLKDYLNEQGVEVYLPKQVIKEAFAHEIISNGQLWINMLEARNSTSHEYKMDKILNLLQLISTEYYYELSGFQSMMRGLNG